MGLKDFNGAGCILADDMGLGKVSFQLTAANKVTSSSKYLVCYISSFTILSRLFNL